MKVTVEQINSKPCTVIRSEFDANYVREQLAMGLPVVAETETECHVVIASITERSAGGAEFGFDSALSDAAYEVEHMMKCLKVILPALPRRPKPEDAKLLHRYAAEGVRVLHSSWWDLESDELVCVGENMPEQSGLYRRCWDFLKGGQPGNAEITHCVTESGQRVDVAIEGEAK